MLHDGPGDEASHIMYSRYWTWSGDCLKICDSQLVNYHATIVKGCLDSMERGTVEWNSGMVGGASLLNELEAKCVVLGLYLLTLEGFSTYLKASRLITKLRT